MTKPDRTALQVAAVVGAVLGGITGYLLSNLVESGGWLKILIWALLVQSLSLASFFVFGLFVRECFPSPLPAALVCRRTAVIKSRITSPLNAFSFQDEWVEKQCHAKCRCGRRHAVLRKLDIVQHLPGSGQKV